MVGHHVAGIGNEVSLDSKAFTYHRPHLIFTFCTQAGIVNFNGQPGTPPDRVDFAFAALPEQLSN
ncbi:hypothetical protein NB16F76_39520 [Escherichia coli]